MATRVTQSLDEGRTTFRAPDARDQTNARPQVIDPVCGMDVDPSAESVQKSEKNGTTYYFCSETCKSRFEKNPEEFIAAT